MIKFLLPLLLFATITDAQISRQQADSLLTLKGQEAPDSIQARRLLQLAQFNILKAGEAAKDLDSAAVFIQKALLLNQKAKNVVIQGYILLEQSMLKKERGQKDQGKQLAEQSYNTLQRTNDKSLLGQASFELSNYYDYSDTLQLAKRIELLKEAIENFKQAGNTMQKADGLQMLADLYLVDGRVDLSMQSLKEALEDYKSIDFQSLQGIYILIGKIYFIKDDFIPALDYKLRALRTAKAVGDTTMRLCEINYEIGVSFNEIKDYNKALLYFGEAMRVASVYNDAESSLLVGSQMATVYRQLGKPAQSIRMLDELLHKYHIKIAGEPNITGVYLRMYTEMKDFDNAEKEAALLLKFFKPNTTPTPSTPVLYLQLITYYIASGHYKEATQLLQKNEKLTDNLNSIKTKISNYRLWCRLDTLQNNYKNALYHLQAANKLSDSVFNATKSWQIKLLDVEFETEKKQDSLRKKDQKIDLLTKNENLQQANLKQARLIRNITLAGVFVLLIAGALFYRQYLQKQKASLLIAEQNRQLQHFLSEKEWLLKELHHRVKNNLHMVISLLESQAVYLDDKALEANQQSQHRIYAMSLIHQKLYQLHDVRTIDMKQYLDEFITYLSNSYGQEKYINFELSIEKISLDIVYAIPLALIINEAVTNSIKHAFPKVNSGKISLALLRMKEELILTIADDGIGFNINEVTPDGPSLGMTLMKGLCSDINANIVLETDNGTKITISFKDVPLYEGAEEPSV